MRRKQERRSRVRGVSEDGSRLLTSSGLCVEEMR